VCPFCTLEKKPWRNHGAELVYQVSMIGNRFLSPFFYCMRRSSPKNKHEVTTEQKGLVWK
jgi:hypothetical protein